MWAFSFMKSNCAARFVDRQMHLYSVVGSLTYSSWPKFVMEFISEFCPKNEIQVAQTNLETPKYFQGSKTIDEYIDNFCEIINHMRYFEGSHIVLKFCQGLNPKVQDHVACMTTGCPSDKVPAQWYNAVILYDENHIANEVFTMASQILHHPETSSTGASVFHRPTP
jgi:hypothetical protein